MRTVVVYESSYGNTHRIAEAIGDGLRTRHEVTVVPTARADQALLAGADLVVVGGPTHVHGMSREQTRAAAVEAASQPGSTLALDPDHEGPGLRDWFGDVHEWCVRRAPALGSAAAFDTRVDAASFITGRASRGISRQLRHCGFFELAEPMSFLVTKDNELVDGQLASAQHWGERLGKALEREAAVQPGSGASVGG